MTLLLCLLLLLVPAVGEAASHVLAWTYAAQAQDSGFVVERCLNQPTGCRMARLATVTATTRRYTDRTAQRRRTYCYQVGVLVQQHVTLWSNIVCSA